VESIILFTDALNIVLFSPRLLQVPKKVQDYSRPRRQSAPGLPTVAVIADVHANLEALNSVLAEVEGMDLYCLGDLVDYGASPNEVVDLIKKRKAVCVLGNHDQAAITGDPSRMNPKAAMSSLWTTRELTGRSMEYLRSLPLDREVRFAGAKT
jgi:hypothetical protein